MKARSLVCGALILFNAAAQAGTAYGTLNNFDTVNDTGVETHGFEIEIEDIHSADITYTYNWNHYGTPKITEDNSNPLHPKVRIRYESAKRADGSWAAYTAIPAGPIAATDGHQFTNPNINFGGEHFGAGYYGNATNIVYHWLIDDGAGNLALGPVVNVASPAFVYYPPAGAPAQVQAVIKPPPAPPVKEFGPATWVKEIRTTSHNNREMELRNLVTDDPDDPNDKNWRNGEPDEVEVEWQILQTEFRKADGGKNGELAGAPEDLNNGDEIVTRRYEFYEYVGPLDPETGEVMTENVGADGIHGTLEFADVVVVGNYIGSQMAAYDNEVAVGLIEHVPEAEVEIEYPTRSVVIAAVPFTATVEGQLPPGIAFDSNTGQLSGTPTEGGIYRFTIRVTAENHPAKSTTYILPVAALGEALPPHSIVSVAPSPIEAGTVSGGGYYTNETTATVMAQAAAGFAFANWTENGAVASRSWAYTFTNIVNRALVANFVPMPALKYLKAPAGIRLSWSTNQAGVSLQQNSDLNTAAWSAVTNPVTLEETNNVVNVAPTTSGSFFRLVRE